MIRKKTVRKGIAALAILLAGVVVFYALRFLIVGREWLIIPEIPIEENSEVLLQPKTEFLPYPAAIIPLIAATLIIIGVLWRKLLIAWIGLVGLAGFAVLFLFSSGAVLLPLVGILLLLLGIVTICQKSPSQ